MKRFSLFLVVNNWIIFSTQKVSDLIQKEERISKSNQVIEGFCNKY